MDRKWPNFGIETLVEVGLFSFFSQYLCRVIVYKYGHDINLKVYDEIQINL